MFLISATFGQELWAKDGKVCFFYPTLFIVDSFQVIKTDMGTI